jgi:hypothetical protein
MSLQSMPNSIIQRASMTIPGNIHPHASTLLRTTILQITKSQPGMAPRTGLGHESIPSHDWLTMWLREDFRWIQHIERVCGNVGAGDGAGAGAIRKEM